LKQDLAKLAETLLADPAATEPVGPVRVVRYRSTLDRTQLMELSRLLTRAPEHVAVLGGEADGRGVLFIGSSSPRVSAAVALQAGRPRFEGRGGGNRSSATAVGEPGEPLHAALEAAAASCQEQARAGGGAR
jgi:alanyl-tRNA synthetase